MTILNTSRNGVHPKPFAETTPPKEAEKKHVGEGGERLEREGVQTTDSAKASGDAAGVNRFAKHELREAATTIGQMSPDGIMRAVVVAQQALTKRVAQLLADGGAPNAAKDASVDDAPELKLPATGAAALIALAGALQKAMLGGAIATLKQNSQLWSSLSDAQREKLDGLQSAYDQAEAHQTTAQNTNDVAKQHVETAQQDLALAQREGRSAQEVSAAAQRAYNDALAAHAPQAELDSLKQDLTNAKQQETGAQAAVVQAQSKLERASQELQGAQAALSSAAQATNQAVQHMDKAIQLVINRNFLDPRLGPAGKDSMSGAAAVTLLMGRLNAMGAKVAQDELESKQTLYEQQQAARQADQKQKAAEFDEQQRKAEQMQKLGCIGKILSGLAMVFGFVAAVFTGGASLVLAAVGLAVFAADQIGQLVTGKSFISEALQPLMDKVLKPLMDFLASVVTKALEACGVAAETAKMAGAIIGGVIAAVALVAASFAVSAVGKIASKLVGAMTKQIAKLAESSIGKFLSNTMSNMSNWVSNAFEKSGLKSMMSKLDTGFNRIKSAIGADTPAGAQLWEVRAKYASHGTQMAGSVVQTGFDVASAVAEDKAMKALAAMKESMFASKLLQQLMSQALETYQGTIEALMSMMKSASATLSNENTTLTSMYANVRRI